MYFGSYCFVAVTAAHMASMSSTSAPAHCALVLYTGLHTTSYSGATRVSTWHFIAPLLKNPTAPHLKMSFGSYAEPDGVVRCGPSTAPRDMLTRPLRVNVSLKHCWILLQLCSLGSVLDPRNPKVALERNGITLSSVVLLSASYVFHIASLSAYFWLCVVPCISRTRAPVGTHAFISLPSSCSLS